MCFFNRNQTAAPVPVAPQVAPAPTRDSVVANPTARDQVSAIQSNAAIIGKRQGQFGNIRTTPMGDATYDTFATFGGRRRAA